MNLDKAFAKIMKIKVFGVNPSARIVDNRLFVSAEDGGFFADYFGEFRGGYPWVHPKLESIANEFGGYWEWENPGCISLCL